MKASLSVLLSLSAAALTSQAALVHFDLSPSGTDHAVGLSPSNEVPVVTNSTGSGSTISGGITFDAGTMVMHMAVGYGSAAGFSDLTGPPIGMHIHSPAGPGTNANVLVGLLPLNFAAANPTNGGVIFGDIAYPTNAVADLLAGLEYMNIQTTLTPGGEVRGQLIPRVVTNSPPTISCPPSSTVECPTPVTVTVLVSDPEGDALTVAWIVNGAGVQTNTLPPSNPPAA